MTSGLQQVLDIFKTGAAVLPFLALCFLSRKNNLKKPVRNRQFLMPVFALIYIVALLISIHSINNWLLGILNKIPQWLNSLVNASWMPSAIAGFLKTPVKAIGDLLKSLDLSYWVFYISNTAVVLLYFAYKGVCIGVMNAKYKKRSALHDSISGRFYEYDADNDVWCLKESHAQTRSLLKAIYYTAAIASSVIMVISGRLYVSGLLASVYYPVAGVILIGELFFYLDGATKKEFSSSILGEGDNSYRTVNYSLLRKYLRSLFGDKLLSENTGVNNALAYNVTNEEILEKLANDPDQAVVNFSIYFGNLNKSGFRLDHNYLFSSLEMLKGKSILFNDPFYKDLIPYAFYPMNRALLGGKKVLVVLGRHGVEDDIRQWVMDGIEAVTNIPFLWRVDVLDSDFKDTDIGIVTRSRVLDAQMHNENEEFLRKVGFVVIIEPSKLVSTAQIGLNLLVKKCCPYEDKEIVYCMCDRNCDGIVDSMSHILMTSITEVSATNKHLGTSSYMCWDADNEYIHHRLFPNVSRYLGMGTELSFAALKNQVSRTYWYGGDVFPVTDIRWIDRQYYYDLMKFASLPTSQDAIDEYFRTSPNMWSAGVNKNNYFTVEDESYNMFEVLRNFATRSTEQGFINVVSSDYLLKDYMAANDAIFEADPKAIPYLAADYARTERNVILRLMLLMSISQVVEETVRKEFSLVGLPELDTREQLWYEMFNCLSSADVIAGLPTEHRDAVKAAAALTIKSADGRREFGIDIINKEKKYNYENGKLETVYSISDYRFIEGFVNELKSSSYVAEDEKGERYFLGSELRGHVYQKFLPGQFFTFDGKYYEMRYLTADNQLMVRRAADHIHGRPEYRQLRVYGLTSVRPSSRIGAVQDIDGIKVVQEYADISVKTPGYYRMERYNDFKTSKKVLFEGEYSGIPERRYNNKRILRIELPDNDGSFTPQVRYTITVLINEVFRTLFADNQPYIIAVTDDSHIDASSECRPLTYSIDASGVELSENSIFIIEDSQIDIGLLITVERNLHRIFEIIHDYLVWNKKEIALSLNPPEGDKPLNIRPEDRGEFKPEKKDNVFKKIGRGIKRFFVWLFSGIKRFFAAVGRLFSRLKRKKKKPVDPDPTPSVTPVPAPDTSIRKVDDPETDITPVPTETDITPETDDRGPRMDITVPGADEIPPGEDDIVPQRDEQPQEDDVPGGDADKNIPHSGQNSGMTDDEEDPDNLTLETGEPPLHPLENMPAPKDGDPAADTAGAEPYVFTRPPYHERYYLLYGYSSVPDTLEVNAALGYLTRLGFADNPLRDARKGRKVAKFVETTFKPNKKNARYCDFCGNEIYGVEYETLADGRDRCISCSRTAVRTEDEFRRLFEDVKRNFEAFFGVKINAPVRVEMVNSQKLHQRIKKALVPTKGKDNRVRGVAIKGKNGFTLMIENGSPRIRAMLTTAHELTHIWQYINWNDKKIARRYGKALRLQIYEGMAKWVEVQYAYLINEPSTAKREEIITMARTDDYGQGFIRYKAAYPLSTGTVLVHDTPFMNTEIPLDAMYCGDVSVMIEPLNGARGYDDDDDPTADIPDPGGDCDDIVLPPVSDLKNTNLRSPGSAVMYAYEHLSEREKAVYDLILAAFRGYVTEVTDIPQGTTDLDFMKAREYVLIDHPEIDWVHFNYIFTYESGTRNIVHCKCIYCLTPEEAAARASAIEASVGEFLNGVTVAMSDYEAAKTVHDNLIRLVDYDSLTLDNTPKDQPGDGPDDLRSVYGIIVNRKGVCAGYARALQYLFNRIGIECAYVSGNADSASGVEKHAWNLAKLLGDYYYIDATWDDHSNTDERKNYSDEIDYDYFCVTTADILRDHKPDKDNVPLPECTALDCNYFLREGLLFDRYSFTNVRSVVRSKVAAGVYTVHLKAVSPQVYRAMYGSLIRGKKLAEIVKYLTLDPAIRVSSDFQYVNIEKKLRITLILKKI